MNKHLKLLVAIEEGDISLAKQLLTHYISLQDDGATALHYAAYHGHLDIINTLIKEPSVNINALTKSGYSPLAWAIKDLHLYEASTGTILQKDLNQVLATVRLLLNYGARIDGDVLNTQIHRLCSGDADEEQHVTVMRLLLEHNKTLADNTSLSACHLASLLSGAIYCNMIKVAQVLLEYDAPINVCCEKHKGSEPTIFAAMPCCIGGISFEMIELLIKYGVDINVTYEKYDGGNSPLHIAVEYTDRDLIQLFLEHGANLNIKNNDGKTPLELAIELADQEIVQLLQVQHDIR